MKKNKIENFFLAAWEMSRPFLIWRILSFIYSTIMLIRRFLYKKNILKSYQAKLKTISVGNLVLGGSGKTPLTIYLAQKLIENGYKPAILSRGYGRKSKDNLIVSDDLKAQDVGDEPYLMAKKVPQALILVGSKRAQLAQKAEALGADILILDDAFQHLALKRDLDLVLFKEDYFWGNKYVLPAGALRESLRTLNEAHFFIITHSLGDKNLQKEIIQKLDAKTKEKKEVFFLNYHNNKLYHCHNQVAVNKDILKQKFNAFCALGQAEGFYKSLKEASLNIENTKTWPDHHIYIDTDFLKLENWLNETKVKYLITTEKDAVKINPKHPLAQRILVAPLEINFAKEKVFWQILKNKFEI